MFTEQPSVNILNTETVQYVRWIRSIRYSKKFEKIKTPLLKQLSRRPRILSNRILIRKTPRTFGFKWRVVLVSIQSNLLLEIVSNSSRNRLELISNSSRTRLEIVSNWCRTHLEIVSNSSRTRLIPLPRTGRWLSSASGGPLPQTQQNWNYWNLNFWWLRKCLLEMVTNSSRNPLEIVSKSSPTCLEPVPNRCVCVW